MPSSVRPMTDSLFVHSYPTRYYNLSHEDNQNRAMHMDSYFQVCLDHSIIINACNMA